MLITTYHRRLMIFWLLTLIVMVSILYDTLYIQTKDRVQLLLVGITAIGFAAIAVLQRCPAEALFRALVASWPLHLFTISFVWVCFAFHGGAKLDQVLVYTAFSYAIYLLVPLIFLLDRQMFQAFVKLIAIVSAVLTLPGFVGALGIDQIWVFPLRNKPSYAEFSGIIASGGIFEHVEGFAYQMAIGMFCAQYAYRKHGGLLYIACGGLTTLGLILSQGRAAIYGVGLAIGVSMLPEVFRRSRPIFLGTLFFALTFPFFIWPQLASIPGLAGYLRIERGMSGRDEAWRYAISVIKKKPWTGHGFMASTELTEDEQKTLRSSGFSGAGTTFHNTFITKAVDLGIIATLFYSLLYLVPISRICRATPYGPEEALVRNMLIVVIATSLFRDYNIGGIRSTAMVGSIFLGLANMWNLVELWGLEEQVAPHGTDVGDLSFAAKVPLGCQP